MPKSVQKELNKLKKIIHPKSRKTSKLTKHVNKVSSREKSKLVHHMRQNLLGEKLLWFRDNLHPDVRYTPDLAMELIQKYLRRFDEELEQIRLKHAIGNRKNRQHASREDIIKLTVLKEEEEFATCGLEVPDILNLSQFEVLRKWNGELRFLQNFKLKRYSFNNLKSSVMKSKEEEMELNTPSVEMSNEESSNNEDHSKTQLGENGS